MRERPLCSDVPSNNHNLTLYIQPIFPVIEILLGSNSMLEIQAIKKNFVFEVILDEGQTSCLCINLSHIQTNEWKGIICHQQMDIAKAYLSGPPCCVAPSFYTKSKKSCESKQISTFSPKYEERCLGLGSALMINIHLKLSILGSWRCQLKGYGFVAHIGDEKT